MSAKINVGVVGCGYWGPNLIRNFASLPDARLRAICDLNTERLRHVQNLYRDVEAYTDFPRFLSQGKLDAVVVATSVGLHHRMAKAAIEAGKHVLVEKPLATSSAECAELVALARQKGVILMAGHTFLYSPVVRRIKQIVDAGDIGEVRYISARRLNLGLFQKDINVAWDLAPHDLSIILYILGELPQRVNCCGSANVSPRVEDVTSLWLGFSKNRSAIVQSSWLDPRKTREMTIVGSRRMIVYDDTASLEKIRIFDARVDSPPHYDTFAEFHYAYHYGDVYVPYVRQEEPLRLECQHFVDCIRFGQRPLSDGEQAHQLVRILEASSLSLQQNGAPVDLTAPAPTPVAPPAGLPPAPRQAAKSPVAAVPGGPGSSTRRAATRSTGSRRRSSRSVTGSAA
ncbi:MAG: Gfo/Idh/MocA family oxidoreductase [Verrucomicrobiae bacterium]|nr:Gfo/Idh/MocA family oxidoreductase [Verrucomicrobiae bacterium]